MSAVAYSRLAAVVFTIAALAQLTRATTQFPVTIGPLPVPLWASWIAFVILAALAFAGFRARAA